MEKKTIKQQLMLNLKLDYNLNFNEMRFYKYVHGRQEVWHGVIVDMINLRSVFHDISNFHEILRICAEENSPKSCKTASSLNDGREWTTKYFTFIFSTKRRTWMHHAAISGTERRGGAQEVIITVNNTVIRVMI